MGNLELLRTLISLRIGNPLDVRTPVKPEALPNKFASPPAGLDEMSTPDIAQLFVSLHSLPQLEPGLWLPAVGAALNGRLATLDPDPFIYLLKQNNNLPSAVQQALSAELQNALPSLAPQMMRKLVMAAVQAVERKSPEELSLAVETAILVHGELLSLDPGQRLPPLQESMAQTLTATFNNQVMHLHLVFQGIVLTGGAEGIREKRSNPVSVAASRELSGKGTALDVQAANVQLMRNAVASVALRKQQALADARTNRSITDTVISGKSPEQRAREKAAREERAAGPKYVHGQRKFDKPVGL